jgi:hypothetical protein
MTEIGRDYGDCIPTAAVWRPGPVDGSLMARRHTANIERRILQKDYMRKAGAMRDTTAG